MDMTSSYGRSHLSYCSTPYRTPLSPLLKSAFVQNRDPLLGSGQVSSRAALRRSGKHTPMWAGLPPSYALPCAPQMMDIPLAATWPLLMRLPLGAASSPLRACERSESKMERAAEGSLAARPKTLALPEWEIALTSSHPTDTRGIPDITN